ncbi:MAG TPA: hypothetical protein VFV38_51630 [Ktedonobacteraceae bacterium]|nr:hypothetical protein [Ktedonobacteraceae bacterium]
MSINASKQALIDYLTNARSKREERGCLAQIETILFLKEKVTPDYHAYAVRYTSTTGQQWEEAWCMRANPDRVPENAWVWPTGTGSRTKAENRFVTTEDEQRAHESQPWIRLSGEEKPEGYWFLHGYLIANGYDVARVRMVPASGSVEVDEVQDGFVLFLKQCSLPIEFELYSPSHALIGKQRWDFEPL